MAPNDRPRRASRLPAGTRVALTNLDGAPIRRLLLGATWDHHDFDVDMSAVLLNGTGNVPSKEFFVYRRNRQSPDKTAFVGYVTPGESSGPDRAQLLIDLEALSPNIERIAVAFSAMKPGTTLFDAGTVKARAMDLDNGQTSYVYLHDGGALSGVSCLGLWNLERTPNGWSILVRGAPYQGGPPAFARGHGVNFG